MFLEKCVSVFKETVTKYINEDIEISPDSHQSCEKYFSFLNWVNLSVQKYRSFVTQTKVMHTKNEYFLKKSVFAIH